MTDQSWHGTPDGSPASPPSGYPPPPYGQYSASYDPEAPYGRHPVSGLAFSDKSKTIAGLLQLLGLFGITGLGRIYIGETGLGIAQLVVGLATCGVGAVIWGTIDALLILTDRVSDPFGRPLRDGT